MLPAKLLEGVVLMGQSDTDTFSPHARCDQPPVSPEINNLRHVWDNSPTAPWQRSPSALHTMFGSAVDWEIKARAGKETVDFAAEHDIYSGDRPKSFHNAPVSPIVSPPVHSTMGLPVRPLRRLPSGSIKDLAVHSTMGLPVHSMRGLPLGMRQSFEF